MNLFPFNGCRGFGGNVVDDAVNVFHFVDDSDAYFVQHLIGDAGPIGGHEVGGGDGAQCQGVVVGSEVAHNADASVVGKDGEVLVDVVIHAGFGDFVAEDVVGAS